MSDKPVRLDAFLVKIGLAASRQRARELITEGQVLVDGLPITKPAAQIKPGKSVKLKRQDHPWVSRGALKLLGALKTLPMEVDGLVCADLGSSTGGFTEVLLHRGAQRVYAIDVGRGQLHRRLETHPKVVSMEGVNARHLESLPEPVHRIVGDLSFISLSLILPSIARLLATPGEALLLVKPQFEAGRSQIAKGGVVRDPAARQAAIDGVVADAQAQGFEVLGGADCEVPGAKAGNVEFFLHLKRSEPEAMDSENNG